MMDCTMKKMRAVYNIVKVANPMNPMAAVKRDDINTVKSIISQSQLRTNSEPKPLIMSQSSQQQP